MTTPDVQDTDEAAAPPIVTHEQPNRHNVVRCCGRHVRDLGPNDYLAADNTPVTCPNPL